ncbi:MULTISPECIES: DUF3999 family protein [Methylomonas]|uniref:DUF3999 family protein n=1 Tax=Methylomonas TaxID=416 RepID=UPI00123257B1|nr:DUF3999 family protein [Methylomonas rhizoryzae]
MKFQWLWWVLMGWMQLADAGGQRFSREVVVPPGQKQALMAVPLDPAVYKASADDFRDLVLLDEQNAETPFALQKIASHKTQTQRYALESGPPSLQTDAAGGIAVTVELKTENLFADGLTLKTAQHDFEYAIRVEGSDDGRQWQPLLADARIFDYARYMAVAKRDVALPANRYKFLRIGVDRASQARTAALSELTRTLRGDQELQRDEKVSLIEHALHIDGVELWREQTVSVPDQLQTFDYQSDAITIRHDADNKLTLVDVVSGRQPLAGLEPAISTPNFSRSARVLVNVPQGVDAGFREIASGRLEAIRFQDIEQVNTHLAFAEQRRSVYRIVIEDRDNPPLQIAGVTGTGPGYQLVFIYQPDKRYRLLYGAKLEAAPRYDIEPIVQLQRQGYRAEPAGLGAETEIRAADTGLDMVGLLNSNGFLGLVIVLMVLVLGWSLYQVGKRTNEMP